MNSQEIIIPEEITNLKPSTINKEESYWFIRWIVMRRNYLNTLKELEEIKNLDTARLYEDNKRLQELLIKLRLEMFPQNKTKRTYKKRKK
jgi:hypothetical protein